MFRIGDSRKLELGVAYLQEGIRVRKHHNAMTEQQYPKVKMP